MGHDPARKADGEQQQRVFQLLGKPGHVSHPETETQREGTIEVQ